MTSIWEYANPKKFIDTSDRVIPALWVLSLGTLAIGLIWGFFFTPDDYRQGSTVKIFYLHVPAALMAINAWFMMLVASLIWIIRRHHVSALAARAAAPVGMVMTLIALLTGAIWGQPMWGTWWVWDGRLTSMLILLFLYLAYIALSQAVDREGASSRLPAIFGLVGAVNIPIINRSVVWWNSLHQPPSITMGQSAIDAEFLVPLLIAVFGFSLLFAGVVLARMRALLADVQAEARLRRRAMEAV